MNSKSFEKIFPLGSHLCREPMPPMSELKKDMALLKKQGFNLVKLQTNWMIDEPLEGHYDFSKYEELIVLAGKLGMGVYLGMVLEHAPGWLWRKYPDCRMIGKNGVPIAYEAQQTLPADGKPGPCYDHPGAAADMGRFIQTIVRTLGQYENLVVWNPWQEVGYWAEVFAGQAVCYCPHTIGHYQRWLAEKYGDLDALNRTWNTRYMDWSYVIPDRVVWKWPMPQTMYWNYFMANVQIPHVLKIRAEAIRQADPLRRPIFVHKGAPQVASGADWAYARSQDFLGSSIYPAWGGGTGEKWTSLLNEMVDNVVLRFDYIRSANRRGSPVWAAEFQGGPISTGFHLGRVPSPDDIRRWMLAAVGAGVTAICFWVTRSEIAAGEANGFGLLDSEGDTSPRFQEAARVGKALGRHADLLAKPSWPGAEVAILVNEENYQFCQTMYQGGENLLTSVSGWHRALWNANIPVDFVEAMELDEEYVQNYKAIVLPLPICLSEAVAAKLVRYVEGGGNLISEAAPGRIDENCYGTRGELSPRMRELFGVRQASFTMVREPGGGKVWSPPERTWGEYLDEAMLTGCGPLAGRSVRANVYVETFTTSAAAPFLRYNDAVAGTVRKAGKGGAWLLGTYVGHNGIHYRDEESQQFIRSLLERCGVKPITEGKLILRKRAMKNKEAWFLTNPTAEDVVETVHVKAWKKVDDLLGEPIRRKGDRVELTVKALDVKALILSK